MFNVTAVPRGVFLGVERLVRIWCTLATPSTYTTSVHTNQHVFCVLRDGSKCPSHAEARAAAVHLEVYSNRQFTAEIPASHVISPSIRDLRGGSREDVFGTRSAQGVRCFL